MIDIRTFAGHTRPVFALQPSADGTSFLSRSRDNTACLWETNTGRQLAVFPDTEPLVFTPNGAQLLHGGADGLLSLREVSAPEQRRSFGAHAGPVRSVAVSPDGRQVLSGGEDGTMRLWDLDTGLELYREEFRSPVTGVDISPSGDLALCCLEACLVVECDLRDGRIRGEMQTSEQDNMEGVSYSPGGAFGLYAFHGERVVDLHTRKEIDQDWGGSGTFCFTSDDRLVARVTSRGEVEIWELRPQKLFHRIETGAAQVYCIALSPDDTRLLCGTQQFLHLFDVETGGEVDRFPAIPSPTHCGAFLPGGAGFLTGHGRLEPDGRRGLMKNGEYVYYDTVARLWNP